MSKRAIRANRRDISAMPGANSFAAGGRCLAVQRNQKGQVPSAISQMCGSTFDVFLTYADHSGKSTNSLAKKDFSSIFFDDVPRSRYALIWVDPGTFHYNYVENAWAKSILCELAEALQEGGTMVLGSSRLAKTSLDHTNPHKAEGVRLPPLILNQHFLSHLLHANVTQVGGYNAFVRMAVNKGHPRHNRAVCPSSSGFMWMKAQGNSILKGIDAVGSEKSQSSHLGEHQYLFNGVGTKSFGLQTAVALAMAGQESRPHSERQLNLAAFGAGYGLVELDLALAIAAGEVQPRQRVDIRLFDRDEYFQQVSASLFKAAPVDAKLQMDMCSFPCFEELRTIPPASLDVFSFFGSLLYVPREQRQELMSRIQALLRPGGVLVVHENIKPPQIGGYTQDYSKMFEPSELDSLMGSIGKVDRLHWLSFAGPKWVSAAEAGPSAIFRFARKAIGTASELIDGRRTSSAGVVNPTCHPSPHICADIDSSSPGNIEVFLSPQVCRNGALQIISGTGAGRWSNATKVSVSAGVVRTLFNNRWAQTLIIQLASLVNFNGIMRFRKPTREWCKSRRHTYQADCPGVDRYPWKRLGCELVQCAFVQRKVILHESDEYAQFHLYGPFHEGRHERVSVAPASFWRTRGVEERSSLFTPSREASALSAAMDSYLPGLDLHRAATIMELGGVGSAAAYAATSTMLAVRSVLVESHAVQKEVSAVLPMDVSVARLQNDWISSGVRKDMIDVGIFRNDHRFENQTQKGLALRRFCEALAPGGVIFAHMSVSKVRSLLRKEGVTAQGLGLTLRAVEFGQEDQEETCSSPVPAIAVSIISRKLLNVDPSSISRAERVEIPVLPTCKNGLFPGGVLVLTQEATDVWSKMGLDHLHWAPIGHSIYAGDFSCLAEILTQTAQRLPSAVVIPRLKTWTQREIDLVKTCLERSVATIAFGENVPITLVPYHVHRVPNLQLGWPTRDRDAVFLPSGLPSGDLPSIFFFEDPFKAMTFYSTRGSCACYRNKPPLEKWYAPPESPTGVSAVDVASLQGLQAEALFQTRSVDTSKDSRIAAAVHVKSPTHSQLGLVHFIPDLAAAVGICSSGGGISEQPEKTSVRGCHGTADWLFELVAYAVVRSQPKVLPFIRWHVPHGAEQAAFSRDDMDTFGPYRTMDDAALYNTITATHTRAQLEKKFGIIGMYGALRRTVNQTGWSFLDGYHLPSFHRSAILETTPAEYAREVRQIDANVTDGARVEFEFAHGGMIKQGFSNFVPANARTPFQGRYCSGSPGFVDVQSAVRAAEDSLNRRMISLDGVQSRYVLPSARVHLQQDGGSTGHLSSSYVRFQKALTLDMNIRSGAIDDLLQTMDKQFFQPHKPNLWLMHTRMVGLQLKPHYAKFLKGIVDLVGDGGMHTNLSSYISYNTEASRALRVLDMNATATSWTVVLNCSSSLNQFAMVIPPLARDGSNSIAVHLDGSKMTGKPRRFNDHLEVMPLRLTLGVHTVRIVRKQ